MGEVEVVEVIQEQLVVVDVVTPAQVEVIEVIQEGPQGPPGIGGDGSFQILVTVPSATWNAELPFGFTRRPNVAVYVGDELVEADVFVVGATVSVIFPSPQTGVLVIT